jgi:small-conductance mechanosensitive channel
MNFTHNNSGKQQMIKSRSMSFHDQIRFLRIMFFIMLGGQVVFFVIAFLLRGSFDVEQRIINIFDYLIPVILFTAIFFSRFLYRTMIYKSKRLSFSRKTDTYRSASITSLAVLEGANLTAILAFMLTDEYLYAAASIILFLLFMLSMPSEEKFRMDLELTPDEMLHTE